MNNDVTFAWVGVFVGFLVFISLLATIYYFLRRKTFTRERFAFVAMVGVVTGFGLVVNAIVANVTPIAQLLGVLEYLKTGTLPVQSPLTPSTTAMLIGLYAILCWFAFLIFKHWDGAISKSDHVASEANKERGMIALAGVEFARILAGRPMPALYSEPLVKHETRDLGQMKDISWNDLAKTLLAFKKDGLEFGQWRNEHEFWFASHRDHQQSLAIKCAVNMPTTAQMAEFLLYLKQMPTPPQQVYLLLKTDYDDDTITCGDQQIVVYTKNKLLKALVNFDEYRDDIKRRATEDLLIGSPFTLADTYTPTRFTREGENAEIEANLEGAVKEWLTEPSDTQLAILGEYGQGKSSTALMLTHHLLSQGIENLERIPILIELRGRSPKTMEPGELLSAWGDNKYGISSRKLEALHQAGRLLFIFDGFDEMELVGNPQERLDHFQALWRFNHSTAKIIITGRPNLFLDDIERKSALGLQANSAGRWYCEAWSIEKFNPQEIRQALRASPAKVADGVIDAIEKNPSLLDIAGRPSLLLAMSQLWESDKLPKSIDQLTSAKVMELFVDLTLSRQAEKPQTIANNPNAAQQSKNYMVLNDTERRYFMQGIAVYMMQQGDTNQIRLNDLEQITKRLAQVCPQLISNTHTAFESHADTSTIKQKINASGDFLGRLVDDVRTCGLLVTDVVNGTFRFSHKSFLEYLAADYAERLYAQSEGEEEFDDIVAIREVTESRFVDVLKNSVASYYFAELVIERRSAEQIQQDDPQSVAQFLLNYMIKPSWLTKKGWRISLWLLGMDQSGSLNTGLWGIYYRVFLYPIFLYPLRHFSMPEKRKLNFLNHQAYLARAWVGVSQAKGCELPQLYGVLLGNKPADGLLVMDPVGLLNQRTITVRGCRDKSEFWLREQIKLFRLNFHRYLALEVLIQRFVADKNEERAFLQHVVFVAKFESFSFFLMLVMLVMPLPLVVLVVLVPPPPLPLLEKALLSLLQGLLSLSLVEKALLLLSLLLSVLPLVLTKSKRDYEATIHLKLNQPRYKKHIARNIQKAMKKTGLSYEEINRQIEELNEYLGWDLRESVFPPESK